MMEVAKCSEALTKFIILKCSIIAIAVAVCLILVFCYRHYNKKFVLYRHKCDRERAKTIEPFRNWSILAAIVVLLLSGKDLVPAAIDLHNESYACVQGEYSRSAKLRYKHKYGIEVVTADGESVTVRVPSTSNLKKPPLGKHKATIWYGETSGYVLYFVLDD